MENFNREYKRFASAAKEAGYSEIERRALARNPERILNEGGKSVRRELGTERLTSFFSFLGGHQSIKSEDIRTLALFFSKYRQFERGGKVRNAQVIPEGQTRLLNLGCELIEDAFYRGNLTNLPKDQRASLTLAVNILSKMAKDPRNKDAITGFHPEKMAAFVEDVRTYTSVQLDGLSKQALDETNTDLLERVDEQRTHFNKSRKSFSKNLRRMGPMAVPYLVKVCLIASDMSDTGTGDADSTSAQQDKLAVRQFSQPYLPDEESGMSDYHFFEADHPDAIYGRPHFLQKEIPFAIWSLRYLRSRKSAAPQS